MSIDRSVLKCEFHSHYFPTDTTLKDSATVIGVWHCQLRFHKHFSPCRRQIGHLLAYFLYEYILSCTFGSFTRTRRPLQPLRSRAGCGFHNMLDGNHSPPTSHLETLKGCPKAFPQNLSWKCFLWKETKAHPPPAEPNGAPTHHLGNAICSMYTIKKDQTGCIVLTLRCVAILDSGNIYSAVTLETVISMHRASKCKIA